MRDGAPLLPRWLTALLGLGAFGYALFALRGVVTPVFFAFLLAYLLDPVVDRIAARGMRRDLAIAILLGTLLGGVTLFLLLVVPGIVRDVRAFLERLPSFATATVERYGPLLASYGIPIPTSVGELVAQLGTDGASLAEDAISPLTTALRFVVGGTASALGAVAGVVLIPVFAFYLLHDFDRIVAAARDLVPHPHRERVVGAARDVDEVLGQFIRGQLIVMVVLAVLFALGYGLVGIRLALPIGIAAGLLSFIPYVGAGVALGLGLAMVAFDGLGWGAAFGVVGVYTAVQLLEGFVITPRVVGEKVGLSSVGVLFALMVGGEVFGFLGVLLAVPAAAVLKIFVVRGIERYKGSVVYTGLGAEAGAESDADRDSESDRDSDAESDSDAEPDRDADSDSDAEPESESDSDAEPEPDRDAESDSDAEPDPEPVSDPDPDTKKAPSPVEC